MDQNSNGSAPDSLLAGRYALQAFCGQGGMGTVYKALDTQLNRTVAAKCVQSLRRSEDAEGILREGKILASFSHKNVVQVYDIVSQDGNIWLISEYLDGLSLDKIPTPIGSIPCIAIITQLYEALSALHSKQIYHRDLKPGNVFVTRSGAVKLIDFGVAFHPQESTGRTMAGTLQYCDPRILAGEMPKFSSDLYSAALVTLELLTGEQVWPELAPLPIYRLMTKSMDVRIGQLSEGMFPPIAELVRRSAIEVGKAREPNKHTLTAESAAQLLAHTLKDLGIDTPQEVLMGALVASDFTDQLFQPKLEQMSHLKSRDKSLIAKERAAWMSFRNRHLLHTQITEIPFWTRINKKSLSKYGLLVLALTFSVIAALKLNTTKQNFEVLANDKNAKTEKISPIDGGSGTSDKANTESIATNPDPALNNTELKPNESHSRSNRVSPASKTPSAKDSRAQNKQASLIVMPDVKVTILADGWADVFIDGKSAGRIPRAKPFIIAPGYHQFRLISPFLERKDERIEIPAQDNFRLSFKTTKVTQSVTFRLSPGGELSIDHQNFGFTAEKTLNLSLGSHRVEIHRAGQFVKTKVISVNQRLPTTIYF